MRLFGPVKVQWMCVKVESHYGDGQTDTTSGNESYSDNRYRDSIAYISETRCNLDHFYTSKRNVKFFVL